MFMPRRVNVAYLVLDVEGKDGRHDRFDLADRSEYWSLRGCRWRYLEDALLAPSNRQNYLPAAMPRLAERFSKIQGNKVTAYKEAYPVPLLEPDGTGNPMFSNSDLWLETVTDRENFVPIRMNTVELSDPTH